jgi:hypothetical protein
MTRNVHPVGIDKTNGNTPFFCQVDDLLDPGSGLALLNKNFTDATGALLQSFPDGIYSPEQVVGRLGSRWIFAPCRPIYPLFSFHQ